MPILTRAESGLAVAQKALNDTVIKAPPGWQAVAARVPSSPEKSVSPDTRLIDVVWICACWNWKPRSADGRRGARPRWGQAVQPLDVEGAASLAGTLWCASTRP
ncbi:hypothetical protein ACTMU2_39405 [Cupriavidus basilensis]